MQGVSRQHGRDGGEKKPRKTLTFQEEPQQNRKQPDSGLRGRLSQSTPNLMDKDNHGLSTKKLQSGLRKLTGRWKGSQTDNKMESAYSETNISAVPHYDLEFPSTSDQLFSTVQEPLQHVKQQEDAVRPVRHIYDEWKDLRRGVKYQVPEEFSLFWVVLSISSNKRFKMKLYFDPDRRQVYVNWDTQVGYITYFDGIRTYRIECMTTIERQDIWSMRVCRDKTLQISCNFEPVAQWKLISDQNLLCVQPMRFGGKYYLTTADGLPPRSHQSSPQLQPGISMVELDRSNSNTAESVASSEEYNQEFHDTYDEATIKFNSLQDLKDHYYSTGLTNSNDGDDDQVYNMKNTTSSNRIHVKNNNNYPADDKKNQPQTNIYQIKNNSHYGTNTHQPQSIYKDRNLRGLEGRVRGDSDENNPEMSKVKQLSNDLISLISQLESDFRENENSFKQKIKTLDILSRNMVQTLKTIQRESRDSRSEMKRREADQLNSTIALEDRIARIEDLISGSEYDSMADGFADVIQQFIDTNGFSSISRPKNILPNFKQQMEQLKIEVNDKIKSLNKRMKVDQSSVVRELNYVKSTVENFREKTQTILLELESAINSCAEENRHIGTKLEGASQNNDDNFTRVQDQMNAFDLKLNSLDAAIEELEERQISVSQLSQVSEDVSEELHYTTVADLSDVTHFAAPSEAERRRVSGLPSIQEEGRLEELEKTCRDLLEQVNRQNKQIELLREENIVFRGQLREDLGLTSSVEEDAVPTENMSPHLITALPVVEESEYDSSEIEELSSIRINCSSPSIFRTN